ncbi:MAG: 4-hydroxy-tetrahydrodipicolinate synthase [bacterium]
MFTGSMVAIVTPFRNGAVDIEALGRLIELQIAGGTDVIVPCGTTGESATLTHEEHHRVIQAAVQACAGRKQVLAGTGSNNTEEAIQLTRFARKAGADGALLITPYYNKPTQEGLYQHFAAVARAVDLPIVVYNVPSRTSVSMSPETVARLAEISNIVGIKEATGSLQHVSKIVQLCGPDFAVISGDDFTTLPLLAVGGVGVISVTANVAPRDTADMVRSFREGNLAKARELHHKLWPLHEVLFMETNPIPVKAALAMMGVIGWEIRLPMTPLSEPNRPKLRRALEQYGLIEA